jgi:hypothetical protein
MSDAESRISTHSIRGIQLRDFYGLCTYSKNFQQDWKLLQELESAGEAHRVGWGIAYELDEHTFILSENVNTDPETFVQTVSRWFTILPGTGIITSHNPPAALWDPREQSNDFDPEEL